MAYVLIGNGVVIQKQQSPGDGFIEAPESVVCGFLYDGSEFTAPPPSSAITPEANGAALDERQKKSAKEEVAALAKSGDLEAAFNKILELI